MLKIGKISYWHVHAWDYTNQALEHPDTAMAAVWDENEERGRAAAEKLGVPYFANLEDMLANGGIDAVIVDAPTNRHEEVMLAAAAAGKHIFTEKVVAPTLKEVNAILKAIDENGVKLTVSLPRLNDGYTLAIRELLEKETLGQITQVRVRLSHNGALANWLPEHFYSLEQCAGGALIDLGCHPMYLTRLFLGELPSEVSAQFGYVTGREVEDNAVALLRGAGGAVGIVEAGFVNPHSPFSIEVHGTKGSLFYGTPESELLVRAGNDEAWKAVTIPVNRESAFHQWVSHIQNGTTADENIRLAKELTMLMEAAGRSVSEGRAVRLNELEG
ncbi:Gfo/Idh/MocA family oxidoreductase [Paenibacillus sp. LHD-117]|uniref:Gfo/Idh/MocA family protein n=1 Tax=Paenibacillus sp. LHD-117 TaxID=3071412 RepID=UPI0027DF93F7|nr:Gfo/Idh/MocA family oxidoreductase [Paenibacillus sp. LHD-117]MDQ6422274.1 Gfo/Idh/MocA family oxidoreductase [Paenibacillus sp. LHD-117]